MIAATVGGALGLLFSPKDGSAIRNKLASGVKNLAHRFNQNREEVQAAVQDIFGEATDELVEDYISVKSHILAGVQEMGDAAEITKRKFETLVEDMVDEFSEGREWSKTQKKDLVENLKSGWETMKEKFEAAVEDKEAA